MAGTHGGNSTCNFSRLASADLDEVKLRICDLLLLKQVESSIDEVGCSVVTGMAGQGRRAGCVGAVFYLALAPTLVGAIVGGAGTTRIAGNVPCVKALHRVSSDLRCPAQISDLQATCTTSIGRSTTSFQIDWQEEAKHPVCCEPIAGTPSAASVRTGSWARRSRTSMQRFLIG